MKRPTGVTVIAILLCLGASFLGLGALAFFLLAAAARNPERLLPQLFARIGILGGGVYLILAIISAVLAVYLLKLTAWARYATIIFVGAGMVFAALEIVASLPHMHAMGIRHLCVAAVEAWMVFYLMKPSVKDAFDVGRPVR
jgi:hypothetical protein